MSRMIAGLDEMGKEGLLGEEGKGGSGGWWTPVGRTPNAVDREGHLVMPGEATYFHVTAKAVRGDEREKREPRAQRVEGGRPLQELLGDSM